MKGLLITKPLFLYLSYFSKFNKFMEPSFFVQGFRGDVLYMNHPMSGRVLPRPDILGDDATMLCA